MKSNQSFFLVKKVNKSVWNIFSRETELINDINCFLGRINKMNNNN